MTIDPASYRDPAGQVHRAGDRIFRAVHSVGLQQYLDVRDCGGLNSLIEDGSVISAREIDTGSETGLSTLGVEAPDGGLVLEHPKIPFISYPYEWCFGALKSAALLHLDIQIRLLDQGIVLSDASAYNVQFQGPRPIFIDFLSFRKYRDSEHWTGHTQFCEQFLNPLILRSYFGVPFNDWYRGRIEGIPTQDLARLIRWRQRLSWRILSHVILKARLQGNSEGRSLDVAVRAKSKGISRKSYHAILIQLRHWISNLSLASYQKTVWSDYARNNTYESEEASAKREFVARFVKKSRPTLLLDIGCNTGDYSEVALSSGAKAVIGLDADHGALDQAFDRALTTGMNFLPLYQDSANPSPGQGWDNIERQSIKERSTGVDGLLALAFEHHLAIGRNIPLREVIRWIVDLSPCGIVEFVPKEDPTIQKMLALRDDIFPDYSRETFILHLKNYACIVEQKVISASGRELFWFERTE